MGKRRPPLLPLVSSFSAGCLVKGNPAAKVYYPNTVLTCGTWFCISLSIVSKRQHIIFYGIPCVDFHWTIHDIICTHTYIYICIYIVYINILYIHRFPRNILHSHFFETFTWLQPCSENLRNGRRWVRCGCSVVGHNNSCHNVAHGSQYRLKRTRGESLRVFQTPKKTGIIVYRGILFFWEPLIFLGGKSNFDANIVLLVILRDFPVPLNRGQSLGW